MSWEDHQQETYAAIDEMAVTQDQISALRAKIEADVGMVAAATGGENSHSEAGRNAWERTVHMLEVLDDVYRNATEAIAELHRYAGGF